MKALIDTTPAQYASLAQNEARTQQKPMAELVTTEC